jgi:kynurenine formamidase
MFTGLGRVIDLTHPLEPEMPVSVGFPPVTITKYLDQAAGDVATVEVMQAGLHTGTHVDAPLHFVPGAPAVDELDPLALTGPAVVVDIPGGDDWVPVEAADLQAWESRTGERIARGDLVILRTGHAARWWRRQPEGTEYMVRPWPHLTTGSVDLFLDRGIRALGVECPDPDRVDQRDLRANTFEGHKRLLGAGVLIIENLAHLDEIPVPRFDFLALALPIRGASASPIRALALIPAGSDRAPDRATAP